MQHLYTFVRDRIFGIGFSMIPSTSHWMISIMFAKSPIMQLGLFVNSNLMSNGWITNTFCVRFFDSQDCGQNDAWAFLWIPHTLTIPRKTRWAVTKILANLCIHEIILPSFYYGDWLFHKAMTSFRILVPAEAIRISWNDCQNGQMITYKICLRHFTHSWIRSKRSTEPSQGSVFSSGHDFGDFDANLGTVTWIQCFFLWPTTCFSGV